MNDWLMLGLGLLLTLGTGIFVASEFSMLNLERNELEARAERGEKGLSNSIRALKRTATHLSGAQLGITLTTMLTGFLTEPALSNLLFNGFPPALKALNLWGHLSVETELAIALVLTMFITTLVSTLFGELVPKKLALTIPLAVNRFVVGFQLAFTWIFSWMIRILNAAGNGIVRSLGIEPKEELSSARTAEELSSLVRRSASLGALDAQTATLLTKTLALSQLVAADVMTPRTRMASLHKDDSVADVIDISIKTGYSRFPIIEDSSDDVVGVAHVKNAAAIPREKRAAVQVTAIMVEALRVPETMRLEALMVELRAKGLQLAIVVDEYGGVAGLTTLEDLVEELVGELVDEHDRAKAGVTRGANSSVLFPGMTRPDELVEMAIKVPADGAYETVAGYLMSALGRIPSVGDTVAIEDGILKVERMDGRRVDRVRFSPTIQVESEGAAND
jgi:CBS domain containing-hemolysin-like protein